MFYTSAQQSILLNTARDSIRHGLASDAPLGITLTDYPKELTQKRATFVTLKIKEKLRGCIGNLEPFRPLVEDVVANAFAAAFHDVRFPRLSPQEFDALTISISILHPPTEIAYKSEADLLAGIRPGVDGLVLQEGAHRATFLPSVWESLPSPKEFLHHLKLKAGLAPDYWSDTIRFKRYVTDVISEIRP